MFHSLRLTYAHLPQNWLFVWQYHGANILCTNRFFAMGYHRRYPQPVAWTHTLPFPKGALPVSNFWLYFLRPWWCFLYTGTTSGDPVWWYLLEPLHPHLHLRYCLSIGLSRKVIFEGYLYSSMYFSRGHPLTGVHGTSTFVRSGTSDSIHLSLNMGYMYSKLLFWYTSEAFIDMVKSS